MTTAAILVRISDGLLLNKNLAVWGKARCMPKRVLLLLLFVSDRISAAFGQS